MDPSNNTETDDETIALRKKRARRVSFADNEITSVHIFRRDDEDSESPHESTNPSSSATPDNEVLGFFRDLGGDTDDEDLKDDDDDGESVDVRKSFLKPIGSPSPGSSTAGSIASTDDEGDFPGPVSASFIRPGQLSDSAASDDNHDLTMDSTAFSMHYRSLACSDSGDLKTPTRFPIPFDEKTSSQTSGPIAPGSSMELTKVLKQSPQPSGLADKASSSRDSNDMSIVGENPRKYDYDRLSPSIDAMLAEGSKDIPAASQIDPTVSELSKQSKASVTWQNRIGGRSSSDLAMDDTAEHNISVKELFLAQSKPGINRYSTSSPVERDTNDIFDGVTSDILLNIGDNTVADASTLQIFTPDSSIKGIKEFVNDPFEPDQNQLNCAAANRITPSEFDVGYHLEASANCDIGYHYSNQAQMEEISSKDAGQVSDIDHKFHEVYGNQLQGSMQSKVAGGEQPFMGFPDSSSHNGDITPPSKLSASLLLEKSAANGETLSSIRKNISKLRNHGTYSRTSSLREGIDRSKCRLSQYSSDSLLFNRKDSEYKHIGTLNASLHDQLFSVTPKTKGQQNLINMDGHGVDSLKKFGKFSENKENVDSKVAGEPFHCISDDKSHNYKKRKSVDVVACPSPMLDLTRKKINFDLADSTAFEVAHFNQFSKAVYQRKLAESPAKKVQVVSTCREDIKQSPVQEASILLPSMLELPCDSLHHNMQNLSPEGNSDDPIDNYHQELQVAQCHSTKPHVEICSEKKCKGTEISQENIIDEKEMIGSSPGVHKSGNIDLHVILGKADDVSEREKLGDQTLKHCVDFLKMFSGSTKQLLCPSADKLSLTMVDNLGDILDRLQRFKKYEILCSEIYSQKKITDSLSNRRQKRVLETRLLLYKIAYEKAKLQLMHMKRERLQKKVQQLRSGLQESQMLKLNCTSGSSKIKTTTTPAEIQLHSGMINSEGKHQVPCNKMRTMMQELETLACEAKSLRIFFSSCCKLEGELSFADTITLIRDYLKKRMSYMGIFENLQLWEIDDFQHEDGCYKVLLNYCGYILQRFIVNIGSATIIVSNKLNDHDIVKTFPNMDAFAAFEFVFNPDTTKKCTGSRCLAQETQIASSFLSNLLEVIEEVQLARIEIRNLVQAKFYSQSAGQLNLLFSFIDFNTMRNFKVILDMTCLKCGVYPLEILPSHMYQLVGGEQKSLPVSLEADITSAAKNERVGHSRIMRLCKCIAQAVQASTPSSR